MTTRQNDSQQTSRVAEGQDPTEITQRAHQYVDRAQEQAERLSERALEGIERAAEAFREQAEGKPYIPNAAGDAVAGGMEQTAGYLRKRGPLGAASDVQGQIRSHPMMSLVGAAVAGYFVGRLMR